MSKCKGCQFWKWVKADKLYQTPGYIIDDRELIAYWTEDTRRATILEKRPRQWYRFKPLVV